MAQVGSPPAGTSIFTRFTRQPDHTTQAQNTFWMAVVLFLAVISFAAYTLSITFQTNAWQLLVTSVAELTYGGVIIYAAYLSLHQRVDLAVKLIVGGLMVLGLIAAGLTANVGLAIGFAVVITTWAMTAQVPGQNWTNLVLIIGFILGIIDGALELFPLSVQLVVPQLQNMAPWAIASIVLAFITLFFWQFRSFNLQTKLITVFLVVSMLSVGIVAFLNNLTTSTGLIRNVGFTVKSLAVSQSTTISDLLQRQLNNLQLLSLNKVLQAKIEGRNLTYTDSPEAIEAKLKELDRQWISAQDTDPYVQIHFNRVTNAGASELAEFQKLFPDHIGLFVTDRYGGLVAATNRISNYYQANEEWWQAAFNNGQGNIFIDQIKDDESNVLHSLIIAMPIYDPESGEVIGILHSTYHLQAIQDILDRIELGQTGQAELYLPGGLRLASDDGVSQVADGVDPKILAQVLAGQVDFVESTPAGEPILLSAAPVAAGNLAIGALGWNVIVYQSRQEALMPIQTQLQNTLFVVLVIIGGVAIAAVILTQILAGPIIRLTTVAQQVAAGDLHVQGRVESADEIGQLTAVFNTMTGRLRETIDTLEMQVVERTRQLATAVEISQRLVGILDLSDLMRQVVTLTKETFNYYHVHIYLREGETLLMAEGYGQAGAEMKRQGHHIALEAPQSLVAQAARERQVIIVENVRSDPTWLPNPLLPDTRAEMAVPVLLDDEVVGVLDVQSEKIGELTHEDEASLRLLANQIAIAVRNARAFAQTQEALYEAQRLQRVYTLEAWEQFRSSRTTTDFESRQPTVPPLKEVDTPEAVAALQQNQTITLIANGQQKPDEAPAETPAPPPQAKNALATPLKLRDEIIGVLGIHDDNPNRRWTEEEIALVEAVSEQMSLALDNARLFEHTQRDAWRNRIISETTAQVWASADIEEVMKAAVAQLGSKLNASEVVIRLSAGSEFDKREESF
ncbi:MAG: GAF domain-containing protein [Chloroflexota bacterium]